MKRNLIIILLVVLGFAVLMFTRKEVQPVLPSASNPTTESVVEEPARPMPSVTRLQDVTDALNIGAWSRLRAIGQLGNNLSTNEIEQAFAFLHQATGEEWEAVVKNDLLNVLRRQIETPAGLERVLADMIGSNDLPNDVRDYALQHLIAFYPKAGDKEQVVAAIRNALADVETSIAGTALLGLRRLEPVDESIAADEVHAAARAIAMNERASELPRVTAIRLCGEFHIVEALPEVRAIVLHENNALLRVAAIGALGEMGEQKDEALLTQFIEGNYPRLAVAAEAALTELREKNQT